MHLPTDMLQLQHVHVGGRDKAGQTCSVNTDRLLHTEAPLPEEGYSRQYKKCMYNCKQGQAFLNTHEQQRRNQKESKALLTSWIRSVRMSAAQKRLQMRSCSACCSLRLVLPRMVPMPRDSCMANPGLTPTLAITLAAAPCSHVQKKAQSTASCFQQVCHKACIGLLAKHGIH